MFNSHSNLVETDVLVIGAGAGGLIAALSAKRHAPPGTRVTIVDGWAVGRAGHTAFSTAWTVVVLPEDDLKLVLAEIINGNDGVADQELIREVLTGSHDQLQELEAAELNFAKDIGPVVSGSARTPYA